jgi:hypothetical protein
MVVRNDFNCHVGPHHEESVTRVTLTKNWQRKLANTVVAPAQLRLDDC